MFAPTAGNPIRVLEHSHDHLTKLAIEVAALVRPAATGSRPGNGPELANCLRALRDGLLEHFAREEEGLFPFVRARIPHRAPVVDRLESAHDTICGAIVRLAHLVEADTAAAHPGAMAALHERFETAYAEHSRAEADLFAELRRTLNPQQATELAALLRGL